MSILARIQAHGGDASRDGWQLRIRRGRLGDTALEWLREPENKRRLMREVWAEFDDFEERAAIREYDGGESRDEAESAAYAEIMAR